MKKPRNPILESEAFRLCLTGDQMDRLDRIARESAGGFPPRGLGLSKTETAYLEKCLELAKAPDRGPHNKSV